MLTTKSKYAVAAAIELASAFKDGCPVALKLISSKQNIPIRYLEQIFVLLKNANLVLSTKGPSGGYKLADKPENIKILSIINAVGENFKIMNCSRSNYKKCLNNTKCKSHDLWYGLDKVMKNYLDNMSLKDASL